MLKNAIHLTANPSDLPAGFLLEKLKSNFADRLPDNIPIFLYHCHDDQVIPFSQLDFYKQNIKQATFREIKIGGHQLNNDLTIVANDIKSL